MQQSRARMLTAHTCSNTCSNRRFNSTSDGSHSSLHATFRLTFRPLLFRAQPHKHTHPRRGIHRFDSRRRFSAVENRSCRETTPTCVQPSVCADTQDTQAACASRHRSQTLSQAVRGIRHTPAAASRWSKNRPRRPPTCVQPSVRPDTQGTQNCLCGRAIAPRHSHRLCAAAGPLPPSCIDG
jgi:hypothetical protein